MIDKKEYYNIKEQADKTSAVLVAVSKTQPIEKIMALYELGHRDFGENRVGELLEKAPQLPEDIQWHFIGNLQSKKIKILLPTPFLIHSVDRKKLLRVIQKESEKLDVKTRILIQVKIAEEERKSGFGCEEASAAIDNLLEGKYPNIELQGLMAMATFTENQDQIRREFSGIQSFFNKERNLSTKHREALRILSIGMSGDYPIALDSGSNMLRIGSAVFGPRQY